MKHYNVTRYNDDGSMDVEDALEYDIPDDDMPAFQLGYLDGAFDKAHWMGEEKSHDWGGEAWGLYEDYDRGYWDGWNNTEPLDLQYVNLSRNWQEWLEDDEYDIPDDAITINRLFVEYEQTIAELRRQLRDVQTRYVNLEAEAMRALDWAKQKGYKP